MVRGCPGTSSRAGLRLGVQDQGLPFLLGPLPRGCWGTYGLSLGASVSFVARSTRFTLSGRRGR